MNPNGIVFGADSRLDIKGAFVATTGNSFLFDQNQVFTTIDPQSPPLLLVKTPLGIQMGSNSGDIINRSVAPRINPPFPLTDQEGIKGRAVSLIGSNIHNSGAITAEKISLAAVKNGIVNISPDLKLNSDRAISFGDITIDKGQIDASGAGAGTIGLRADKISLNDSQITAYTLGAIDGGAINLKANNIDINRSIVSASTFSTGRSGDIAIQADQSLNVTGAGLAKFNNVLDRLFFQGLEFVDPNLPKLEQPQDFGTGILALSFSPGNTGNLRVETPKLVMTKGAFLSTLTFVAGNAGNLQVIAPEITLDAAQLNAESQGNGNSGNILLQTQNLRASNGSVVAASTFGRGRGGNVTIGGIKDSEPATNLTFDGNLLDTPLFSGIFTNTFVSGNAGAIDVFARDISLTRGASIASVGPVIPFLVQIVEGTGAILRSGQSIASRSMGRGEKLAPGQQIPVMRAKLQLLPGN